MSSTTLINGDNGQLTDWSQVNWRKVRKNVRNLRQRILGSFPYGELTKRWLKAGFIYKGQYNPTETGTPQGGVISPILANIGLHGLETYIKSTNPKLGFIRYADDFIVTSKDFESLDSMPNQINGCPKED